MGKTRRVFAATRPQPKAAAVFGQQDRPSPGHVHVLLLHGGSFRIQYAFDNRRLGAELGLHGMLLVQIYGRERRVLQTCSLLLVPVHVSRISRMFSVRRRESLVHCGTQLALFLLFSLFYVLRNNHVKSHHRLGCSGG